MEDLQQILSQHPFFADLSERHLENLTGCAANVCFEAEEFIFKAGETARHFFLIRTGKVSAEIYVPQKGAIVIDTAQEGEVFGWSWLFEPYRWHFDARALELTRAIAFDAQCVREKEENDHELGHILIKNFARVMQQHLQATRLQLLDMYARPENSLHADLF